VRKEHCEKTDLPRRGLHLEGRRLVLRPLWLGAESVAREGQDRFDRNEAVRNEVGEHEFNHDFGEQFFDDTFDQHAVKHAFIVLTILSRVVVSTRPVPSLVHESRARDLC
jgi:hypothetical protein